MALGKTLPTPYGVAASYWKIGSKVEAFLETAIKVILVGYVDQAARQAGKQPLATLEIILKDTEYSADDARAALYTKLKAQAAWSDATDV